MDEEFSCKFYYQTIKVLKWKSHAKMAEILERREEESDISLEYRNKLGVQKPLIGYEKSSTLETKKSFFDFSKLMTQETLSTIITLYNRTEQTKWSPCIKDFKQLEHENIWSWKNSKKNKDKDSGLSLFIEIAININRKNTKLNELKVESESGPYKIIMLHGFLFSIKLKSKPLIYFFVSYFLKSFDPDVFNYIKEDSETFQEHFCPYLFYHDTFKYNLPEEWSFWLECFIVGTNVHIYPIDKKKGYDFKNIKKIQVSTTSWKTISIPNIGTTTENLSNLNYGQISHLIISNNKGHENKFFTLLSSLTHLSININEDEANGDFDFVKQYLKLQNIHIGRVNIYPTKTSSYETIIPCRHSIVLTHPFKQNKDYSKDGDTILSFPSDEYTKHLLIHFTDNNSQVQSGRWIPTNTNETIIVDYAHSRPFFSLIDDLRSILTSDGTTANSIHDIRETCKSIRFKDNFEVSNKNEDLETFRSLSVKKITSINPKQDDAIICAFNHKGTIYAGTFNGNVYKLEFDKTEWILCYSLLNKPKVTSICVIDTPNGYCIVTGHVDGRIIVNYPGNKNTDFKFKKLDSKQKAVTSLVQYQENQFVSATSNMIQVWLVSTETYSFSVTSTFSIFVGERQSEEEKSIKVNLEIYPSWAPFSVNISCKSIKVNTDGDILIMTNIGLYRFDNTKKEIIEEWKLPCFILAPKISLRIKNYNEIRKACFGEDDSIFTIDSEDNILQRNIKGYVTRRINHSTCFILQFMKKICNEHSNKKIDISEFLICKDCLEKLKTLLPNTKIFKTRWDPSPK